MLFQIYEGYYDIVDSTVWSIFIVAVACSAFDQLNFKSIKI